MCEIKCIGFLSSIFQNRPLLQVLRYQLKDIDVGLNKSNVTYQFSLLSWYYRHFRREAYCKTAIDLAKDLPCVHVWARKLPLRAATFRRLVTPK